jgi:hypothetical protein
MGNDFLVNLTTRLFSWYSYDPPAAACLIGGWDLLPILCLWVKQFYNTAQCFEDVDVDEWRHCSSGDIVIHH